ncbi:spore coat associated protein CotJA [Butyricicoccus sp. Marseille-Q5471]|uniref:spore coat associated protein CotJA n=1 Tax=Butyricicoccus sp. Marseille-Q5471 TaxID=3039493 RepID=UPI0024BBFC33|nr:spore coat associated protein CotJA [Butyricicoccus sp. Marseille-Q5471]
MNMQSKDMGQALPADSIDPRLLSLAMGFVPAQSFETPYDPSLALARGTIFPSLDKPFLGEEALPR